MPFCLQNINVYIYILESCARFACAQFSLKADFGSQNESQGGQNLPKIKFAFEKPRSMPGPAMAHRNWTRFWLPNRAPRRPEGMKIRVQTASRMKKMKLLIFYTPPLQNHYFWLPVGAKMWPQWRLEAIFMALENLDGRAMPFRALSETLLHL